MSKASHSHQRAFTLIELLVVISLIGLLSSIVLASINNTKIKARDARKQSDLVEISTTLERYWLDNNSMPTGPAPFQDWCAIGVSTCAQELVSPNYFKSGFPTSPVSSDPYYYKDIPSAPELGMPNGYGILGVHLEKNIYNSGVLGIHCSTQPDGSGGGNVVKYYCLNFVK